MILQTMLDADRSIRTLPATQYGRRVAVERYLSLLDKLKAKQQG